MKLTVKILSAKYSSMSKPFRIGFAMALGGLIVNLITLALPSFPLGLHAFYFGLCWVVWLVCLLLHSVNKVALLCALWFAIDLAILPMVVALGFSPHRDDDIVLGITYFAVIFPFGPFLYWMYDGAVIAIRELLAASPLGPSGAAIADWVGFSLIAATQSAFYVSVMILVTGLYRTLTRRSSGTPQKRGAP